MNQTPASVYAAAMDSVTLINAGKPAGMSQQDWMDGVARNKEHLRVVLAKDIWTDEDLNPLQEAAKQ